MQRPSRDNAPSRARPLLCSYAAIGSPSVPGSHKLEYRKTKLIKECPISAACFVQ